MTRALGDYMAALRALTAWRLRGDSAAMPRRNETLEASSL